MFADDVKLMCPFEASSLPGLYLKSWSNSSHCNSIVGNWICSFLRKIAIMALRLTFPCGLFIHFRPIPNDQIEKERGFQYSSLFNVDEKATCQITGKIRPASLFSKHAACKQILSTVHHKWNPTSIKQVIRKFCHTGL